MLRWAISSSFRSSITFKPSYQAITRPVSRPDASISSNFPLHSRDSSTSSSPSKPPGKARTPPKPRPKRPLPPLVDEEVEETWVRGSGPGGQSINKTNISCSLRHLPTGIRVQCHETRSRELNRLKARRRLQELIDMRLNPGESMLEDKWKRERAKKNAKARKSARKKSDGVEDVQHQKKAADSDTTTEARAN
ncbi:hypothetical protein T439DRAFT_354020 [Meredithblackwellia eburnea MCA 4105]